MRSTLRYAVIVLGLALLVAAGYWIPDLLNPTKPCVWDQDNVAISCRDKCGKAYSTGYPGLATINGKGYFVCCQPFYTAILENNVLVCKK